MTATEQGIVLLIKSAITGAAFSIPEDFSGEEAVKLARKHQISSLVYTGAVNCGLTERIPALQELFMDSVRALMKSEGQLRDLERLYRAFQENQIDFLPLKGCDMKLLYPKPELRTMGDADILIRVEQYDRIRPVMRELGFEEVRETDHELVWRSKDLYVELHKHLIPSYTKDYYDYFGNGWQLAKPFEGSRYAMSREDAFIFLFTHFAKHYRDGGAGCRYILDLWIYRQTYPELDEAYLRRELKMLRIGEFYDNVRCLIQWWFEDGTSDPVTEFLSNFIFTSGVWGEYESNLVSLELRSAVNAGSIRKGRNKYLMFVLFPPVEVMGKRYPVVERHPWLLPVFWPIRWISALLFRRNSIRAEREYQKTVAPEQVRKKQEALRYVGLDFNFG